MDCAKVTYNKTVPVNAAIAVETTLIQEPATGAFVVVQNNTPNDINVLLFRTASFSDTQPVQWAIRGGGYIAVPFNVAGVVVVATGSQGVGQVPPAGQGDYEGAGAANKQGAYGYVEIVCYDRPTPVEISDGDGIYIRGGVFPDGLLDGGSADVITAVPNQNYIIAEAVVQSGGTIGEVQKFVLDIWWDGQNPDTSLPTPAVQVLIGTGDIANGNSTDFTQVFVTPGWNHFNVMDYWSVTSKGSTGLPANTQINLAVRNVGGGPTGVTLAYICSVNVATASY